MHLHRYVVKCTPHHVSKVVQGRPLSHSASSWLFTLVFQQSPHVIRLPRMHFKKKYKHARLFTHHSVVQCCFNNNTQEEHPTKTKALSLWGVRPMLQSSLLWLVLYIVTGAMYRYNINLNSIGIQQAQNIGLARVFWGLANLIFSFLPTPLLNSLLLLFSLLLSSQFFILYAHGPQITKFQRFYLLTFLIVFQFQL